MTESSVASPCINVCRLNEDNICKGCFRTREEIVGWKHANDDERRAIITRAEDRATEVKAAS
jgi:predicted Fe-S protein YdhL (DUF1289 family)